MREDTRMLGNNSLTAGIHGDELLRIERRLNQWELVEQAPDGLPLEVAEAHFRQAFPEFDETALLDELRVREYGRLDQQDHVYLDYTGGNLYAESQLREHMALLQQNVLGNPHSTNPTSMASTRLIHSAQDAIFDYFNASPDEYVIAFTANATGALKLVGESYPFGPGARLLLTFDNHNSVNGIREFARAKHAQFAYAPIVPPDLRIDESKLEAQLDLAEPGHHNLFAFPGQSNFSGVRHSLEWIARAQAKGWDVLLDGAAFTPTNRLDLSQWHPDFVSLSFYKIFGYPTGVGCLLARKAALAKLQRPWFGGGTIQIVSVQGDNHYMAPNEQAFEDGTVNYLSLPAVEIGLRYITDIGIDLIHKRVACLTEWLLNDLTALRHHNHAPLVRIYGPTDLSERGGSIAVNFFDPQRRLLPYQQVEARTNQMNISIRTGCFCNPGGREMSLGFSEEELKAMFRDKDRMTYEEFVIAFSDDRGWGAVRASLGLATTFRDVYRFGQFARSLLNKAAHEV